MSPKHSAIVLLSGGLDSLVSLAQAQTMFDEISLTLTFNYGQQAFGKEIRAARQMAHHYGLAHEIISLPWLAQLLPQTLCGARPSRPQSARWQSEGAQQDNTFLSAPPVWVPNRNGVFLNIAASYAEKLGASTLVFGANLDEGHAFPDNTAAYRQAQTDAFAYSTLSKVQVVSPLEAFTKTQIVEKALALNAPLDLVWSCYQGFEKQCGLCPSCYHLKTALATLGKTELLHLLFLDPLMHPVS
jgi:7-cyano-7-deazaguanine synthase